MMMVKTGDLDRSRDLVLMGKGADAIGEVVALSDYAAQWREYNRDRERRRIAAVVRSGVVPAGCGAAIPNAPARGPVQKFTPVAYYPKGEEGYELKNAGWRGCAGLRIADVFDVMTVQARRKGGPDAEPPFSKGQVDVGRLYGQLSEKHAAAGVRCSSIEAMASGSATGGDFMDAVLMDADCLAWFHRRIGNDVALAVRRVRPSQKVARGWIMDRTLVDMVCLEGRTLKQVLQVHGWPVNGYNVKALRKALCACLDRMRGLSATRKRSGAQKAY